MRTNFFLYLIKYKQQEKDFKKELNISIRKKIFRTSTNYCLSSYYILFRLLLTGTGLQAMVSICKKFAKSRSLKFSTDDNPAKSKTKCVIFHKAKTSSDQVAPIVLNGDPLPWVSNVKHLGNILDHTNSMKVDCLAKRRNLSVKLIQFSRSSTMLSLVLWPGC